MSESTMRDINEVFEENIIRQEYSTRGGGIEISLDAFGYEGQLMSAYQNYLGGGLLGAVANDCTVSNWLNVEELAVIASQLKDFFVDNMAKRGYIDDYNKDTDNRPVSAY